MTLTAIQRPVFQPDLEQRSSFLDAHPLRHGHVPQALGVLLHCVRTLGVRPRGTVIRQLERLAQLEGQLEGRIL